jgi:hypothetical protein
LGHISQALPCHSEKIGSCETPSKKMNFSEEFEDASGRDVYLLSLPMTSKTPSGGRFSDL